MKRIFCVLLAVAFLATANPCTVYAQELILPKPGEMVHLSAKFNPLALKGIKVHPDNPFRFDFVLDQGDRKDGDVKAEADRLIKYFLASLTTPEGDMWVNLSPYEKDRIVPEGFGKTQMGRDLLAQDYILKQITASLIYPEDEFGKKFWAKIYAESAKRFGTTNIPVNTFNKVWIVPEKSVVYENKDVAYVVEAKLKVMLEEDYLALDKNAKAGDASFGFAERRSSLGMGAGLELDGSLKELRAPKDERAAGPASRISTASVANQIIREIVIPELTKEINEGENFAQLRQVYNSLILATWYKKKIKDSILSQVYTDKNKLGGITISDTQEKHKIYEQYLQAFKKGVYNYVKEERDEVTSKVTPRKYFSGGLNFPMSSPGMVSFINDRFPNIAKILAPILASTGLLLAGCQVVTADKPEVVVMRQLEQRRADVRNGLVSVLGIRAENYLSTFPEILDGYVVYTGIGMSSLPPKFQKDVDEIKSMVNDPKRGFLFNSKGIREGRYATQVKELLKSLPDLRPLVNPDPFVDNPILLRELKWHLLTILAVHASFKDIDQATYDGILMSILLNTSIVSGSNAHGFLVGRDLIKELPLKFLIATEVHEMGHYFNNLESFLRPTQGMQASWAYEFWRGKSELMADLDLFQFMEEAGDVGGIPEIQAHLGYLTYAYMGRVPLEQHIVPRTQMQWVIDAFKAKGIKINWGKFNEAAIRAQREIDAEGIKHLGQFMHRTLNFYLEKDLPGPINYLSPDLIPPSELKRLIESSYAMLSNNSISIETKKEMVEILKDSFEVKAVEPTTYGLNLLKKRIQAFVSGSYVISTELDPKSPNNRRSFSIMPEKDKKWTFGSLDSGTSYRIELRWEDGIGVRVYFIAKDHTILYRVSNLDDGEPPVKLIDRFEGLNHLQEARHFPDELLGDLIKEANGLDLWKVGPQHGRLIKLLEHFQERQAIASVKDGGIWQISMARNVEVYFSNLIPSSVYEVKAAWERGVGLRIYFLGKEDVVGYGLGAEREYSPSQLRKKYRAYIKARGETLKEAQEDIDEFFGVLISEGINLEKASSLTEKYLTYQAKVAYFNTNNQGFWTSHGGKDSKERSIEDDAEGQSFTSATFTPVANMNIVFNRLKTDTRYTPQISLESGVGLQVFMIGGGEKIEYRIENNQARLIKRGEEFENFDRFPGDRLAAAINEAIVLNPYAPRSQPLNELERHLKYYRGKHYKAPRSSDAVEGRDWTWSINLKKRVSVLFNRFRSGDEYEIQPYWENGVGLRVYMVGEKETIMYGMREAEELVAQDRFRLVSATLIDRFPSLEKAREVATEGGRVNQEFYDGATRLLTQANKLRLSTGRSYLSDRSITGLVIGLMKEKDRQLGVIDPDRMITAKVGEETVARLSLSKNEQAAKAEPSFAMTAFGFFKSKVVNDENLEITFLNRDGKVDNFNWEKTIYAGDVEMLQRIVKQIAVSVDNQNALKGKVKVSVEGINGTQPSRIFLVKFGDVGYIIKMARMLTYDDLIVNQWDILQSLNPKGDVVGLVKPLQYGQVENKDKDRVHYLVTNYLDGTNLKDLVTRRGKLDSDEAIDLALSLARIVDKVHKRGVIIRDLLPRNIMVMKDGSVLLYDFNVSIKLSYDWEEDGYQLKPSVLNRMSEDWLVYSNKPSDRPKPDVQSDVYTFGMSLLEALTRRYRSLEIGESREIKNIPLRRVVERAIERERTKRYSKMSDLIADLEAVKENRDDGSRAMLANRELYDYLRQQGNTDQMIKKLSEFIAWASYPRMSSSKLVLSLGAGDGEAETAIATDWKNKPLVKMIVTDPYPEGADNYKKFKAGTLAPQLYARGNDNVCVLRASAQKLAELMPKNAVDYVLVLRPGPILFETAIDPEAFFGKLRDGGRIYVVPRTGEQVATINSISFPFLVTNIKDNTVLSVDLNSFGAYQAQGKGTFSIEQNRAMTAIIDGDVLAIGGNVYINRGFEDKNRFGVNLYKKDSTGTLPDLFVYGIENQDKSDVLLRGLYAPRKVDRLNRLLGPSHMKIMLNIYFSMLRKKMGDKWLPRVSADMRSPVVKYFLMNEYGFTPQINMGTGVKPRALGWFRYRSLLERVNSEGIDRQYEMYLVDPKDDKEAVEIAKEKTGILAIAKVRILEKSDLEESVIKSGLSEESLRMAGFSPIYFNTTLAVSDPERFQEAIEAYPVTFLSQSAAMTSESQRRAREALSGLGLVSGLDGEVVITKSKLGTLGSMFEIARRKKGFKTALAAAKAWGKSVKYISDAENNKLSLNTRESIHWWFEKTDTPENTIYDLSYRAEQEEPEITFGGAIKNERIRQRLTRQEAKDQWGLTDTELSNYENNRIILKTEPAIRALAKQIGMDADKLIDKAKNTKPIPQSKLELQKENKKGQLPSKILEGLGMTPEQMRKATAAMKPNKAMLSENRGQRPIATEERSGDGSKAMTAFIRFLEEFGPERYSVLQFVAGTDDLLKIKKYSPPELIKGDEEARQIYKHILELDDSRQITFYTKNTAKIYEEYFLREQRINNTAAQYGLAGDMKLIRVNGEAVLVQLAQEGRPLKELNKEDEAIIDAVGYALGRLHQLGISHRDLIVNRGEHIFIKEESEGKFVATFIDFGIAKDGSNGEEKNESEYEYRHMSEFFNQSEIFTKAYKKGQENKGQRSIVKNSNSALATPKKGGIDLNKVNLEIRSEAWEGVKFKVDPVMLNQLRDASGFVPVIINIEPMNNIREFLGIGV